MKYLIIASALLIGTAAFTSKESTKYSVDNGKSVVTWTGEKLVGSHTGTVDVSSGVVYTTLGKISSTKITINMTSIKEEDRNAKLEGHLKSPDFFDVKNHPQATFVSSNIIPQKTDAKGNNYKVIGDLTIKGKSETISFPAKMTKNGAMVHATGVFTFDRSKFDVKYGSSSFFEGLGDHVIYDEVNMTFSILAQTIELN
jgi:polyisoprenoid-binding protein YceI